MKLPLREAGHEALLAELGAFVAYDDRLCEAAREQGLPVVRPAS